LKEKAESYLKKELGHEIYNLRIQRKSRYTYLETLGPTYSSVSVDTSGNVFISNTKLYFCCASHMNIAFHYQINKNYVLQLDLKFDQFGELDTIKSVSLSNRIRTIKHIENKGYINDFIKLAAKANNHGVKGKLDYSIVDDQDDTFSWWIMGRNINLENGKKFKLGILIQVEDLTKSELIRIDETEFGA